MRSAFLQLLHEDGRTEMYKGTERRICVTFFPEIPQTATEWMHIVGVWCYRETEWLMLSVLLYSILSVQIVYSVQLNCTDSNYTEAAATCSAAQEHSTFTVQTVQSATELHLQ